MTKKEWQKHYGFDDETMEEIVSAKGTVVAVRTKEEQDQYDEQLLRNNRDRFIRYGFNNRPMSW